MRSLLTLCSIVFGLCACAPASDRPVTPGDLVRGKIPASESIVRLKQPCTVVTEWGVTYILPVGDYKPVSADSKGIFYEGDRKVEVPGGGRSVWLSGVGIHFPFSAHASAAPSVWVESVDLEWGSAFRRKAALPAQCWRPYGSTMAIVHNGAELPRDRNP